MRSLTGTDVELWHAVRHDNEAAFQMLFERYWVKLYKTACAHIRDKELCEEIVHDIFVNIWERRADLEIQSFPAFLTTAIRYQVHNHYRVKRPVHIPTEDLADQNSNAVYNEGAERLSEYDLHHELNDHMDHLPKRCQEIFQMSRVEQLSNQEIAQRLGISKRTVENQITHALKHLRMSMKYVALILSLISSLIP